MVKTSQDATFSQPWHVAAHFLSRGRWMQLCVCFTNLTAGKGCSTLFATLDHTHSLVQGLDHTRTFVQGLDHMHNSAQGLEHTHNFAQ
jgi:hypothetical protein